MKARPRFSLVITIKRLCRVFACHVTRHLDHIGVPKQRNGGHVDVPSQTCGTLFINASRVSENVLYRIYFGATKEIDLVCCKSKGKRSDTKRWPKAVRILLRREVCSEVMSTVHEQRLPES